VVQYWISFGKQLENVITSLRIIVRHILPFQNVKVRFLYTVENITSVPPGQASAILFAGVDREDIDLDPLFKMAAEYFTHLAVACAHPVIF
jgi:hypothetical protein